MSQLYKVELQSLLTVSVEEFAHLRRDIREKKGLVHGKLKVIRKPDSSGLMQLT